MLVKCFVYLYKYLIMRASKKHEDICGIYAIRNLINNKLYIGKSINIYRRIKDHITRLNSKNKDENPHLINSWWKYGRNNFEYYILEILDKNDSNLEKKLSDKELYWIQYYNSINRNFGYNLRLDSNTKMIIHEETRLKMRNSQLKRYKNFPEHKEHYKKLMIKRMKENPLTEEQLSIISEKNTRYIILQYSKDGSQLIKQWNKVMDIIKENPNYKKHNIYACCSGEKPSMYGFKWVKILKEDIVQTELKDSD